MTNCRLLSLIDGPVYDFNIGRAKEQSTYYNQKQWQGQFVYTRARYGRLSIITLLNGFAKIRQYVTNKPDDFCFAAATDDNSFPKSQSGTVRTTEWRP